MPVGVTKLKRSIMNETTTKDIAPLNLIWRFIFLISRKLRKIDTIIVFACQSYFFTDVIIMCNLVIYSSGCWYETTSLRMVCYCCCNVIYTKEYIKALLVLCEANSALLALCEANSALLVLCEANSALLACARLIPHYWPCVRLILHYWPVWG